MNLTRFISPEPATIGPRTFVLIRTVVVARGIMFAGIVWEMDGTQTQVTECLILWFAMFSPFDLMIDLLEVPL